MIYHFPQNLTFEIPHLFTDPFRYTPHPSVRLAAALLMERLGNTRELSETFAEGKMLGVLVCTDPDDRLCYIAGFSGTAGGKSIIEGFVPPIFDLTVPDGHFRKEEERISMLNERITSMTASDELKAARKELADSEQQRDEEIGLFQTGMKRTKKERDEIRMNTSDLEVLASLIRESQFEKAELRRLKTSWAKQTDIIRNRLEVLTSEISRLKSLRADMSDRLQDWIFRQYIVHNASGEKSSISDIFAAEGIVPPGGTGECAAPKMLEYAFRNGFKPLAMGEFWYGKSPDNAVRTHGHFYPSCTSKCGPLLKYMLKGQTLTVMETNENEPVILHEDETLLIVEKPAGMPSVPGLDGRISLQEWLTAKFDADNNVFMPTITVHAVHRLDMDTSGVMVFAKASDAASDLRKQFEEHSVRKTYMARVHTCPPHMNEKSVAGHIDLPLSPDYDERPRQKVDFKQGKPAYTEYKALRYNADGTADMLLYPYTGRTHQLRVHCAHHLGLGCPIAGDLLYGGHHVTHDTDKTAGRLYLHALSLTFRHPATGEPVSFTSQLLCY